VAKLVIFGAGNWELEILSDGRKSATECKNLPLRVGSLFSLTFFPIQHFSCCAYLLQIHETIETINQLKTQREFMLSFARDPQGFINDWLQSQCRDLKVKALSCVEAGSSHTLPSL